VRRTGQDIFVGILAILALTFVWVSAAPAETAKPLKGVALVIGQGKYEHLTPLANPANDTQAMTGLFTGLGFAVTTLNDLNARRLHRDLKNFVSDAEGADVAVVYYSGHGIEAGGENWLIPIDSDVAALGNADRKLVALSPLIDQLKTTVPITLIFLDACRTNPFPPAATLKRDSASEAVPILANGLNLGSKGVTVLDNNQPATTTFGTVISFAAEPGRPALDGPQGVNSPYATAVLRHLAAMNGNEFGIVMRMVTEEVYLKTQGYQRPWVNETLTRLLYFGGKAEDGSNDEARLTAGRRELLLTISVLPQDLRRKVEQLAKTEDLPLDTLYGMLKALQVDMTAGPDGLDQQLRAGAAKVKELLAKRERIERIDPEITRLTDLADRAEAEGAIPLAQDYRAKASARAMDVSRQLKETEAQLGARHLEVAATFAREAETAMLAFDHRKAAQKYRLASAEVKKWDLERSRHYRSLAFDLSLSGLARSGGRVLAVSNIETIGASVSEIRAQLERSDRSRLPLLWATRQNSLGYALWKLGERDVGTVRLEEALAAFRAALQEQTRDRVPRDWAETQNNLGNVLTALGRRESGTARLEEAVAAYRALLEVQVRDRFPRDWAETQNNLGNALIILGQRENSVSRLEEAVSAFRAALGERPRADAPRDWAESQNGLGNALAALGRREGSTARLGEAIAAFHAALEERGHAKYGRAETQSDLGSALMVLWELEEGPLRLEEAIAAFRAALAEWDYISVLRERDSARQPNPQLMAIINAIKEGNRKKLQEVKETPYRMTAQDKNRERFPEGWAETQEKLGEALRILGERTHDRASIREGKAALQAAWDAHRALGDNRLDDHFAKRIAVFDRAIEAAE
jgi:uncharacterized caspase-like protein